MSRIISDKMCFSDKGNIVSMPSLGRGFWAETEVIGGYGEVNLNPTGKSSLDEEVFRDHNIVPISGVSTIMSTLFEVEDTSITYPTLWSKHQIGAPDTTLSSGPAYKIPNKARTEALSNLTIEKNMVFKAGHSIFGFGVGNTGTAESDISIYKPEYNDCDISLSRVVSGKSVTGEMIPFRYTAEDLNYVEQAKYFGKKTGENGLTAYYLKRFEEDPIIKHVWVDGTEIDEDVEEKPVTNADVWRQQIGVNTISSFTEIILKVSKKDIKEWFNILDNEDRARINTIALFTGDFVPGTGAVVGDYRNCRLFSKLIINPEYLNIAKDLSIIYRVYGS